MAETQAGHANASDGEAFKKVCGACHAASAVSGLRTASEWRETVEHMISIGAKGSDEEFDGVIRVLERTLTKINVNSADAEELAPTMDISDSVAQAIVAYRSSHGNFKSLSDLKKVPGLDASKVDDRKDRILF